MGNSANAGHSRLDMVLAHVYQQKPDRIKLKKLVVLLCRETIGKVAACLGVDRNTLAAWLRGESEPKGDVLGRWIRELTRLAESGSAPPHVTRLRVSREGAELTMRSRGWSVQDVQDLVLRWGLAPDIEPENAWEDRFLRVATPIFGPGMDFEAVLNQPGVRPALAQEEEFLDALEAIAGVRGTLTREALSRIDWNDDLDQLLRQKAVRDVLARAEQDYRHKFCSALAPRPDDEPDDEEPKDHYQEPPAPSNSLIILGRLSIPGRELQIRRRPGTPQDRLRQLLAEAREQHRVTLQTLAATQGSDYRKRQERALARKAKLEEKGVAVWLDPESLELIPLKGSETWREEESPCP